MLHAFDIIAKLAGFLGTLGLELYSINSSQIVEIDRTPRWGPLNPKIGTFPEVLVLRVPLVCASYTGTFKCCQN